MYDELRDAFNVGTYKEIPDSQWNEVATWLRACVEVAATRQQRAEGQDR